ncbi:MAG: hypothetical protein JRJ21_01235 [Deltaproteobacteria bacterium]|nr:hypothetical protein [Deltaproteobacteria bacterium]
MEAGFTRFHFVDNTFNLPPYYARAVCSCIIDAGLDISWRCILYPGSVDENLVREMAKAGCREVEHRPERFMEDLPCGRHPAEYQGADRPPEAGIAGG